LVKQRESVKRRVAEQLKTAAIKNYEIELDEGRERDDATMLPVTLRSSHAHQEGFCEPDGVDALFGRGSPHRCRGDAAAQRFSGTHHQTFSSGGTSRGVKRRMPTSIDLEEDMHAGTALPLEREMRFARPSPPISWPKSLGAKRVLVVPSNPP